jgi:hypothetical protein
LRPLSGRNGSVHACERRGRNPLVASP